MRVKLGAIITEASGKIGGQFLSSDRSGCSLRTKQAVTQKPITVRKSARSNVQYLSQYWRKLSQLNRDKWESAAQSVLSDEKSFKVSKLSGFELFMRVNCNLANTGNSVKEYPTLTNQTPSPQILNAGVIDCYSTPAAGSFFGGGYYVNCLQSDDPAFDPLKFLCIVGSDADLPGKYQIQAFPIFNIGANSYFPGSSFANTQLLAAANPSMGFAAYACTQLDLNGFTDWCLPSRNAAYDAISLNKLPNVIAGQRYWTSTENGSADAYYKIRANYGNTSAIKTSNYLVRPVRIADATTVQTLGVALSRPLEFYEYLIVSASRPLSRGVLNARDRFKVIARIKSTIGNTAKIESYYVAAFGSLPPTGSKCFLSIQVLNTNNGAITNPSVFSVNF